MIKTFLFISILVFSSSQIYIRHKLEKYSYRRIRLSDWMSAIILPAILYILWVFIAANIVSRDYIPIQPYSDFAIIVVTVPVLAFASTGNGIHFASKVLSRYFKEYKLYETPLFYINDVFHNISHYPAFIGGLFTFFFLSLLEINHPVIIPLSSSEYIAILASGTLFAASIKFVIDYVDDGYPILYKKQVFLLILTLLFINIIIYQKKLETLALYPVTVFVMAVLCVIDILFLFDVIYAYIKRKNNTPKSKILAFIRNRFRY